MRAVVQRARAARVEVQGEISGTIERGLVAFVGVGKGDGDGDVEALADKLVGLRVFEDDAGKMSRALAETGGALLLVSQFTLFGDVRRGRRPSFDDAMPPTDAELLFTRLVEACRRRGARVETGRFRAEMTVHVENDGPVTILVDTKKTFLRAAPRASRRPERYATRSDVTGAAGGTERVFFTLVNSGSPRSHRPAAERHSAHRPLLAWWMNAAHTARSTCPRCAPVMTVTTRGPELTHAPHEHEIEKLTPSLSSAHPVSQLIRETLPIAEKPHHPRVHRELLRPGPERVVSVLRCGGLTARRRRRVAARIGPPPRGRCRTARILAGGTASSRSGGENRIRRGSSAI
jgi:D-aminoacyl-tRNA deacylase